MMTLFIFLCLGTQLKYMKAMRTLFNTAKLQHDPSFLETLAADVRKWAPAIVGAGAASSSYMETVTMCLDTFTEQLQCPQQGHQRPRGKRGLTYSAEALLRLGEVVAKHVKRAQYKRIARTGISTVKSRCQLQLLLHFNAHGLWSSQ
eukprot:6367970-Amphidinium_carterae.2